MTEPLDSPQSCVQEIISINIQIAQFFHEWANAAGEVKRLEAQIERLERKHYRHLRTTKPQLWEELKVADREAEVRFEVEEEEPTLYERLAEAEAKTEECKTKFRALDRRASNAQSILAGMREEQGIKDFVYHDNPEVPWDG